MAGLDVALLMVDAVRPTVAMSNSFDCSPRDDWFAGRENRETLGSIRDLSVRRFSRNDYKDERLSTIPTMNLIR